MSAFIRKACTVASGSVISALAFGAAQAADLGGNCCADLEERVAELEATTVRKGNRKVSLTVSGHVHEALFFFDVDATNTDNSVSEFNANESNVYIGTHNSSRSRFRFRGSASINSDWSAGFYMEFGVRRNALNATSQGDPRVTTGIDIRHEALWVKSKTYGTVWLGWTGSATEGITEICLGCTLGNASPDYSFLVNNLITGNGDRFVEHGSASGFFAGEGDRRNMVKWISPTLTGFSLSASWGGDDFWDVALRYAGEFGAIRVAAGLGYQEGTNGIDTEGVSAAGGCPTNAVGGDSDRRCQAFGASASIMHTPTGLYVMGSYGQNHNDLATNGQDTDDGWWVTAGISTKLNSLGKTNFWASYSDNDREIDLAPGAERALTSYGLGVDQKINAAAMEVYLWWRHYEAEAANIDVGEAEVVILGTRIKF